MTTTHAVQRNPRALLLAAPCAPDSLAAWVHRYLAALEAQHRSAGGIRSRRSGLAHFVAWATERGIERPEDVTYAHLERFQQHLFRYRKADGRPMSVIGQHGVLSHVRGWFTWLVRHRRLTSNPAADLELPSLPQSLREPLNLTEVETVLALPDVATPYGLRDRAMLEVFYATGIRRAELVALDVGDVNRERGLVHVRRGKGGKGRFVPLGERADAWIAKYRREARTALLHDPQETALFLNQSGHRLSMYALSWRIRRYLDQAGVTQAGACHLFRHTVATAMLDNGADLRHVQEMLGHALIVTTQRYTHVSLAKLKAVHAATHPAASLTRQERDVLGDAD